MDESTNIGHIVTSTSSAAVSSSHSPHYGKMISAGSRHLILIILSILFLLPFFWLISTSLKASGDVFAKPLVWFPNPPLWSNYVDALTSDSFPYFKLLGNTLFYAISSTIGIVFSSAFVAYGFARLNFWGRDVLFAITLATMMLPAIVTLIPTYVMFRNIGWVGSYAPLIVPHFFGGAFNIFLLRQFMISIPRDLSDAARVDGANEFTIFWKIILPLVKPALLVVALFHFMYAWNDFLGPLIYLDEAKEFPLVLGLYGFQINRFQLDWSLLSAAAVAVTLPLIALFFVAQRYFLQGIAITGLKG